MKRAWVGFLGNIILGLNDGLIELTGALVGFSLAFESTKAAAVAGLIVGISAVFSMAASAYMQSRQESEAKPGEAALYTGGAYLVVVIVLTAPFFIFSKAWISIAVMLTLVILIITVTSLVTANVLKRSFWRQLVEMTSCSLGVALLIYAFTAVIKGVTGFSF